MATLDLSPLTDHAHFSGGGVSSQSFCIERAPGIWVMAYIDTNNIVIKTYRITTSGDIIEPALSTLTIASGILTTWPVQMVRITGDIMGIFIISTANRPYFYTFSCTGTGQLGSGAIDSWNIGAYLQTSFHPENMVVIGGSIIAISMAHCPVLHRCDINTFSVNADGTINKAIIDTQAMVNSDHNGILRPISGSYFFHIDDDVASHNYIIQTVTISAVGAISAPIQTVDTLSDYYMSSAYWNADGYLVIGGHFPTGGGFTGKVMAWTWDCSTLGVLGAAAKSFFELEVNIGNPGTSVANISNDGVFLVYTGEAGQDGWMATLAHPLGILAAAFQDTLEFDPVYGVYLHAGQVWPGIYCAWGMGGATPSLTFYTVTIVMPLPEPPLSTSLGTHQFGFLSQGDREDFYLEFDAFDFTLPGIKFVETVEVSGNFSAEAVGECMVKWRNDKRLPWRETRWKRMSPGLVATPLVAGAEVRVCLRVNKLDAVHIDGITVGWKNVDKRHVRGGYGVAGKTTSE